MSDNEADFSLFVRREFPTRFFAKGETIFREGEQAEEFFVVVRGEVEILSAAIAGSKLSARTAFSRRDGHMIDESARSATVVALTDVTVAPIQEQQFLFMVQHITSSLALRR